MSIETTQHCDGPDCPTWGKRLPILVTDPAELHFCSWDCVLRFGARLEPTEIVHG